MLATGCVGVLDGGERGRDGEPRNPALDAGPSRSGADAGAAAPIAMDDGGAPPIDAVDAGSTEPTPDAGTQSPLDAGALDPGPRDAGPPDAGPRDAGPPDAGAPEPEPPPPACASPIEAAELELTNAARRAAGLGELRCDEGLARAARLHSQDMCDQGYFDHDSLDGRTFVDRIDAQGVRWRTVGENIAAGYRTPEAVHQGWMNSDGHRRNILNGAFGRIGIGYVECGGSPYWTQDFAD